MSYKLNKNVISYFAIIFQIIILNQFDLSAAYLNFEQRSEDSTAKKFNCSECKYGTNNKSNLTVHERIHSKLKPFLCKTCKKRFSQINILKNHLRIHTGEKPFFCHICSYRSNNKANLSTHLMIHNGNKKYFCGQCNYSATSSSTLKGHKKTHEGLCIYICQTCNAKFNNSYALNNHLKRNLNTDPINKTYLCAPKPITSPDNKNSEENYKKDTYITDNQESLLLDLIPELIYPETDLLLYPDNIN